MNTTLHITLAITVIAFNTYLIYCAGKRNDVLSGILSVLAILLMVYSLTKYL